MISLSKLNEEGWDAATSPAAGQDPERIALRQAVGALPRQMRRCTELRLRYNLSYPEIAELLQLSVDTVKAHLFQARNRLRSTLA